MTISDSHKLSHDDVSTESFWKMGKKRKENLFMHCKIQSAESGWMYVCSMFNILKVIDSHKHLHTGNGVQRGSFASTTRWFSDNFPDARCGKHSRDNDATRQVWCNQTCSCFFCQCPSPTQTRTISKLPG